MAERTRLIIDTEEPLRRAVRIRAAKKGQSPSDVINDLIREHLPAEVAEAKREIAKEEHRERRN
jgi:plasmid stability protein